MYNVKFYKRSSSRLRLKNPPFLVTILIMVLCAVGLEMSYTMLPDNCWLCPPDCTPYEAHPPVRTLFTSQTNSAVLAAVIPDEEVPVFCDRPGTAVH